MSVIIKSILNAGMVHALGIVLGIVANILLARLLDPEDFGKYIFFISLIPVILALAAGGMNQFLLKELTSYIVDEKWGLLKGLLKAAGTWVIIISAALILASVLFDAYFMPQPKEWQFENLQLIVLFIPIMGLQLINSVLLKSMRHPIYSEVTSSLLVPSLYIILLLLVSLNQRLTVEVSLQAYLMVNSVALVVILYFVYKKVKSRIRVAPSGYEYRKWFKSYVPFTLIGLVNVLNLKVNILALGLFSSAENISGFGVAEKAAMLVSTALGVANMVTAPYLVEMFKNNKMRNFDNSIQKVYRIMLLAVVPFAVIMIIYGKEVIGFLYGIKYADIAYGPLVILMLGQIVNVYFGSVGNILSMTGYQKYVLNALIAGLILNVTLSYLLIPVLGAVGAALSSMVTLIMVNISLYVDVKTIHKIKSRAF